MHHTAKAIPSGLFIPFATSDRTLIIRQYKYITQHSHEDLKRSRQVKLKLLQTKYLEVLSYDPCSSLSSDMRSLSRKFGSYLKNISPRIDEDDEDLQKLFPNLTVAKLDTACVNDWRNILRRTSFQVLEIKSVYDPLIDFSEGLFASHSNSITAYSARLGKMITKSKVQAIRMEGGFDIRLRELLKQFGKNLPSIKFEIPEFSISVMNDRSSFDSLDYHASKCLKYVTSLSIHCREDSKLYQFSLENAHLFERLGSLNVEIYGNLSDKNLASLQQFENFPVVKQFTLNINDLTTRSFLAIASHVGLPKSCESIEQIFTKAPWFFPSENESVHNDQTRNLDEYLDQLNGLYNLKAFKLEANVQYTNESIQSSITSQVTNKLKGCEEISIVLYGPEFNPEDLLDAQTEEEVAVPIDCLFQGLSKSLSRLSRLELTVPCISLGGYFEDIEVRSTRLRELIVGDCWYGGENLGNFLRFVERVNNSKPKLLKYGPEPLRLEMKQIFAKDESTFRGMLDGLYQPSRLTGSMGINAENLESASFLNEIIKFIEEYQGNMNFHLKISGPSLGCLDLERVGKALEKSQSFESLEIESCEGTKLQYKHGKKFSITFDLVHEEVEDELFF